MPSRCSGYTAHQGCAARCRAPLRVHSGGQIKVFEKVFKSLSKRVFKRENDFEKDLKRLEKTCLGGESVRDVLGAWSLKRDLHGPA